nr:hypothetical protein [Frankia sp. CiP3]
MGALGVGEADAGPPLFDFPFDEFDADVGLGAGTGVALAAETVEVWVDPAPSAGRVDDSHPGAALSAEQRSFQVMEVSLWFVSGFIPCPKNGLNLVERLAADEDRVASVLVENAVEPDTPDVVGVGEYLVDVGFVQGPFRVFRGGAVGQASGLEGCGHAGEGVAAGGEFLPGPSDVFPPVGVKAD